MLSDFFFFFLTNENGNDISDKQSKFEVIQARTCFKMAIVSTSFNLHVLSREWCLPPSLPSDLNCLRGNDHTFCAAK